MAAGYPESIDGDRIFNYNADSRNLGTNIEYSYTFWRSTYPYSDNQLVIHDAAISPIGVRPSATIATDKELQVSSNYDSSYRI